MPRPAGPRGPAKRPDEAATGPGTITPETGLRWAALGYALVSIVIGLILVSRGFGDLLDVALGTLVILQGWALLGFFSLFADLVRNTNAIAHAVIDEETR